MTSSVSVSALNKRSWIFWVDLRTTSIRRWWMNLDLMYLNVFAFDTTKYLILFPIALFCELKVWQDFICLAIVRFWLCGDTNFRFCANKHICSCTKRVNIVTPKERKSTYFANSHAYVARFCFPLQFSSRIIPFCSRNFYWFPNSLTESFRM